MYDYKKKNSVPIGLFICNSIAVKAFSSINPPLHCCTFNKSLFSTHFKLCAQPKIKIDGYVKHTPPGVPFRGNFSMCLTDYLIETGLYSGSSIFEKNPAQAKHLSMANSWQQSKKTLKYPNISKRGFDPSGRGHRWELRTLPVPYCGVNQFEYERDSGGGSISPHCFSGISTLFAEQWNYAYGDLPIVTATSAVKLFCYSPAGQASQQTIYAAMNLGKNSQENIFHDF